MSKLGYARSHRDLIVYQKSRVVSRTIFALTKEYPKEERYSLIDQVRRSSRAIGALIAEGWAKRRYERAFVSRLVDADGEQMETQHWVEISNECDYITNAQANELLALLEEIGNMLNGVIVQAPRFCQSPTTEVREEHAPYETDTDFDLFTDN